MAKSINKIKLIYETTDPLNRYVFLTESTWTEHIISEHVEMNGEELLVKSTVEDPESIYEDKDFSSTNIYFKAHNNVALNPYGAYVKVAVDIDIGKIKTAYCTFKGKEKTKAKYVKKK